MNYKELIDTSNHIKKNTRSHEINMAIISNISLEPYFEPLVTNFFPNGDDSLQNQQTLHVYPQLHFIAYEEYQNPEYKNRISSADWIVVWINLEALNPDIWNMIYSHAKTEEQIMDDIITLCKKLYSDLSEYTNAHVLWFLFEDHYIKMPIVLGKNSVHSAFTDQLNRKLYDMLHHSVSCIDLKRLIADVKTENAYDIKGKYRWNAPYSKVLMEAAANEMYKQYRIEKGKTKKCLVLDCDNVLWGGILSEYGTENIQLSRNGFGRAYQDFQRFVLSLYYHGVILAVCSKNDSIDVMTMFRKHSEMILREEHISCFQVNWENKPMNIQKIAETLNIGLDSIVFVDDSPIEIEAVKAMLPEVTGVLYEGNAVWEQLSCFHLKSNVNVADIEKRNKTYRTNQSREALKSQFENYAAYIDALAMQIDIHKADPIEYNRIAELTQRTNRCTNGKRYTVAEMKENADSNHTTLYSLSVSDRFSDLGLVGALEVKKETLSLFSLSCRALGRDIEEKMLDYIANRHLIQKVEFYATGKNEGVAAFLGEKFPDAILTQHT